MIPKLRMDYYHRHQEESAYLEQPCFYQMSGCKYSSEKLVKKPVVSQCKSSMEGFEYTSLFSSRTYSILSYIVGGFVGSKSQMNNNKHNLSYDLSAAIFNLLNPCKYEKEKCSFKKNNENNFYNTSSKINSECYEKYILNRSSQKSEKMKEGLLGAMELDWLGTMPLQNIVGHENYVLAFNEQCNDSKITKTFKQNTNNSTNCDENKNLFGSDRITSCTIGLGNETTELLNSSFEDLTKEPTQVSNSILEDFTNEPTDISKCSHKTASVESLQSHTSNSEIPTIEETENLSSSCCNSNIKEEEENKTVTDSGCLNNSKVYPNHSICSLIKQRYRQLSECSVESTDSDSFIVFDEHIDVEEGNKECDEYLVSVSDDYDSDDGNDDEVGSYDEYEELSIDKQIAEANNKWFKNYQDVCTEEDNHPRKVRFNDNVKVNKIVAWDYAYRAARPGPWEQMVRDRVRFRERIQRLSPTISPVLRKEHRDKIYKELYS